MADPRIYGPQQRSANLSDLMKAQGKASLGEKVNFCPFGCPDHRLDEVGYCRHLIGFSKDQKTVQPMRRRDKDKRRQVFGREVQPIPANSVLVRITCDYRVYNLVPLKPLDLPPEDIDPDELLAEEEAQADAELELVTRPV